MPNPLLDRLRTGTPNVPANVGTGGVRTAAYLLAKHRFDQGLGPDPDAGSPPAPPGGAVQQPSTPAGNLIPEDDEQPVVRPGRGRRTTSVNL